MDMNKLSIWEKFLWKFFYKITPAQEQVARLIIDNNTRYGGVNWDDYYKIKRNDLNFYGRKEMSEFTWNYGPRRASCEFMKRIAKYSEAMQIMSVVDGMTQQLRNYGAWSSDNHVMTILKNPLYVFGLVTHDESDITTRKAIYKKNKELIKKALLDSSRWWLNNL